MGNLKELNNPIILEERKLDLELRTKMIKKILEKRSKTDKENDLKYQNVLNKLINIEKVFQKFKFHI